MPQRDTDTEIFEYPLPKKGVNLYINPLELDPEEAVMTKNCFWRNGLVKRPGMTKFETDEVQANKKISGLHRFYYSTVSKQLLSSSGTVVRYHDGATWQDVQTGLNDGAQIHFSTWGGVQKSYFSNGNDELYSWDGSSAVTLSGGNIPTKIIMTLPYQDRLLAIDNTNPGTLTWSDSFSDTAANWVPRGSTGVRPDSQLFGMIHHSINNSDSGYEAAVLLAGSNGMYLFAGTDLRTSLQGNYTIYPLATHIGCNAPRTMVWTPKGTMYLGVDKQVYILPFKSSTPIPIGHKVTSLTYITTVEGIEDTPSNQIEFACAVYHDGFYKLSVAAAGGSTNTIQWWLDVDRLTQDENQLWGPWFGPMEGQAISVFTVQSGAGDSGQLIAGSGINGSVADSGTTDGTTANKLVDSTQNFSSTVEVGMNVTNTTDATYAKVTAVDSNTTLTIDNDIMVSGETYQVGTGVGKSIVYEAGQRGAFGDDGTAIAYKWQSFFNPLGSLYFTKEIHKIEAELRDITTDVDIEFSDITGNLKIGDNFGVSGSFVYWGDDDWGVNYWSDASPTRQIINISPAINSRRVSITVSNSSSDNKFELYALRAEAKQQSLLFG